MGEKGIINFRVYNEGMVKKLNHQIIKFYKPLPEQDVVDLRKIVSIQSIENTEFGVLVVNVATQSQSVKP